jgi:hypothetical protein
MVGGNGTSANPNTLPPTNTPAVNTADNSSTNTAADSSNTTINDGTAQPPATDAADSSSIDTAGNTTSGNSSTPATNTGVNQAPVTNTADNSNTLPQQGYQSDGADANATSPSPSTPINAAPHPAQGNATSADAPDSSSIPVKLADVVDNTSTSNTVNESGSYYMPVAGPADALPDFSQADKLSSVAKALHGAFKLPLTYPYDLIKVWVEGTTSALTPPAASPLRHFLKRLLQASDTKVVVLGFSFIPAAGLPEAQPWIRLQLQSQPRPASWTPSSRMPSLPQPHDRS